jgi:hypothetical protein
MMKPMTTVAKDNTATADINTVYSVVDGLLALLPLDCQCQCHGKWLSLL